VQQYGCCAPGLAFRRAAGMIVVSMGKQDHIYISDASAHLPAGGFDTGDAPLPS
jgi:hypothetical protein